MLAFTERHLHATIETAADWGTYGLVHAYTRWYSAAQARGMATGMNGQLLGLSGKRDSYPRKLGLLEEAAYADLLLVDGNPLENIDLIANPDQNLRVMMKDIKFYKNQIQA
jgi:imidazolonepropionase-like amidohydrolase